MSSVQAYSTDQIKAAKTAILGIGTALPPFFVTQEDACHFAQHSGVTRRYKRALPTLYKQSGVNRRFSVLLDKEDTPIMERQSFFPILNDETLASSNLKPPSTAERMAAYREHAGPLAVRAAKRAIEVSGTSASELTHLITVSCSGFAAPGVDFELIRSLQLSSSIQRTHIGFMGCHASLNAMRVAHAICQSNSDARVMVCAVELCTIHQQYTDDPQQLVANSLFGDGAAALILQNSHENQISESSIGEHSDDGSWFIHDNASLVLDDTSEMMSWNVGDSGFEMTLSPQVPEIISRRLKPWLQSWLAEHALTVSDIANWVVHPGGPRILSAVQDALELEENALEHSWRTLQSCGNMSSPTVLFILESQAKSAVHGPTVMLGFGPGLVAEACLLFRE